MTDCLYTQEAIVTSVELGEDWERTELLHKKFEEFQVDLGARKGRVDGVNQYANECAQVRGSQPWHLGLGGGSECVIQMWVLPTAYIMYDRHRAFHNIHDVPHGM